MSDVQRPTGDSYLLVGDNWPSESESAYHAAELNSDALLTAVSAQAESADDAARQTDSDMKGQTADSVSGAYSHLAALFHQQSQDYTSISGWMVDAASEIRKAKKRIVSLVHSGTSEVRTALESEVNGAAVSPSSSELIDKYRADIAAVKTTLESCLDSIGHSLAGDSGSSRTPTYASVPTTPSIEHADPHAVVVAFNHGDQPVEPHQLPPMPRASTPSSTESPSAPGTSTASSALVAPHPTLSNLVAGSSSPSGTQPSPSAKSPSTTSAPTGQQQARQPNEQHQPAKSPVLPRIPSIGLPNIPAAAESIATAVGSVSGQQLPTAAPAAQAPASTGFTPGTSGAVPVPSAPPAGLSPVGGLPTPPVTQAAPVAQGAPAAPPPGAQTPVPAQQTTAPAAPRGPVADLAWIQKSYGLTPGLDLPKPENHIAPMLFIADMAESEAQLHRALATLRHAFDDAGWGQPMTVARIKRGLETRTVYATSDGLSIWPQGILLPHGVIPLDEMTSVPATSRLAGSVMVSEKLTSLIPRGWEVEGLLSTVPAEESSQSVEQFQELVESGELLNCKVSRGQDDVGPDEALRVFARAAIDSAGCSELDVESARIRAARWIGTQPTGYLDVLSRYHLADAAEAMSLGRWGEAVYSSEKYLSIRSTEKQVA